MTESTKIKFFLTTIVLTFASTPLFGKLYLALGGHEGSSGWWGPSNEAIVGFMFALFFLIAFFVTIDVANAKSRYKRALIVFIIVLLIDASIGPSAWDVFFLFFTAAPIVGWLLTESILFAKSKKRLPAPPKLLRLVIIFVLFLLIYGGIVGDFLRTTPPKEIPLFLDAYARYYWIIMAGITVAICAISVWSTRKRRNFIFGTLFVLAEILSLLFGSKEATVSNIFVFASLWLLTETTFELDAIFRRRAA